MLVIIIRDSIRTVVRNLGLTIFIGLLVTIAIRGFSPISEGFGITTATILALITVSAVVIESFSEEPGPVAKRLSRMDVTLSLLCLIAYIGGTTQLMAI